MSFSPIYSPVRKPANRSGSHIIGKFPSLKLGRTVLFESTIERDLIYFLDYESRVSSFMEQPFTIEYSDEGKTRRYTPDFHVMISARDWVLECKPEGQADSPDNRRKYAAAREYCAKRGWGFRVVVDREIRFGFRLRNIKILRRFALYSIPPQIKGCILGILAGSAGSVNIDELATAPGLSNVDARAVIFQMAFLHELDVPLNKAPVSGDSMVFLPGRLKEEGLL